MNNGSSISGRLQCTYEQFIKYMPEASTITSVAGGMIIGVVGQPFSNWKRASQHAPKGTTKRTIYNNIVAPRSITDLVTGRVVAHGGGIRNFWAALPWGMLGSTVKQGTKGTALVKVDNTNLPGYIKAIFSAGIITTVITPFDRISNALVSSDNKHLSKIEVVKKIVDGGLFSIYKGAGTNVLKDLIEVSLIRTIRYYKAQYVKSLGREVTAQESAMMAFLTTVCKLIITQPLDGIKADLQQTLKEEGKAGVMDVVRRQGMYKLFTAGLGARFILNYLSILTSFYAMQLNDYLQKQKVLDRELDKRIE